MKNSRWALLLALVATFTFAACGGGGSSSGGEAEDDLTDLVLIDVNVGGTDGVALNQVLVFEFSEEVVGDSVSPATMQIRLSPANAWQVPGNYNISGNVVEFFPRLPNMPDLSDSGLKPGQTYEIRLPGSGRPNTLTNADGDPLAETVKVSFATAIASSPNLFVDYNPDEPPHVVSINPKPGAVNVPQSIDLEITFSEPLHPATMVPSNVTLTMTHRPPGTPLDPQRTISGQVHLDQSRESTIARFVPNFPLADNATYELVVDRRVSDLVGNDLVKFQSTFTIRDEPPVPGELVLEFDTASKVYEDVDETIASWDGDIPGTVCAIYTAGGGNGSDGDFDPFKHGTLSSDTKTEWQFRKFEVAAGRTIKLTGSKPILIRALAGMKIEGTIDGSGENGTTGESSSTTWQVPVTPGGQGGPGGGAGGDVATNVPSYSNSSYKGNTGSDGEDGWNTSGTGGQAAQWGPSYYYKYGTSGGGGGGHRTKGKDGQNGQYPGYSAYNGNKGKGGGTGGNADLDPITAGGGGGPGMNSWYYSYPRSGGAGAGGGGGGAFELVSPSNIEIIGGTLKATGGNGGRAGSSSYLAGGSAGGGAGGAIKVSTLRELILQGATVDVEGGDGAPSAYTYYKGKGGDGGDGWVLLEDGDGSPSMDSSDINPNTYATGTFTVSGAGAPSVAQTLWINLGIFDPKFSAPGKDDILQALPIQGQTIKIEVQATTEDLFDFGQPDLAMLSNWVDIEDIATLNGQAYSFLRFRITFTLPASQELDDPMPYVDRIRVPYEY